MWASSPARPKDDFDLNIKKIKIQAPGASSRCPEAHYKSKNTKLLTNKNLS